MTIEDAYGGKTAPAGISSGPPREVAVRPRPLSTEQKAWYEKACKGISEDRVRDLIIALTNIHSPTGAEREASEYLVAHMNQAGLEAHYQPMGELSGNAIGRIRGRGDGPALLFYDPIDTHLEADPKEDIPWVGPQLRADMLPKAVVQDGLVIGLGASNPKAMVATMVEAARCVQAAGIPLKGDLYAGFAGGGMPWNNVKRNNRGLSDGVTHLLTHGVSPDFAVIMKPWNVVFYEEPGLCFFKVTVKGTLGYAGIPHGTPGYENATVAAAPVILDLHAWIPKYAERNTSGQIQPWGCVSAVRGGWPDKPSIMSSVVEIYLDLRYTPRMTPAEVGAQFGQAIDDIRKKHPTLKVDWEMTASSPCGSTDPDNWIIQSAMRGWEYVEGTRHGPAPYMAGQTDGGAIRKLGIPTARIGWPWPYKDTPAEYTEGIGGMGVAYIPDLIPAVRKLIYMAVDTCTRTRAEVGL